MKVLHQALLFGLALALSAQAGDPKKIVIENPCSFDNVRRPITNPTLFDTALPLTKIHAMALHQNLADTIDTTLGQVPLGGDMQVYAVQAEFALSERFSVVATKDGYIDFSPDATLRDTSGWANIAGGAKWAWLYRPETGTASSLQLLYEFPSGDRDVWQGTGDGFVIPSILFLKSCNKFQYSNVLGFRLPTDSDANGSTFYTSHHLGFHLTDWFYPLVELNWFHVMAEGDGGKRFDDHAGGLLPAIATFEDGDLVDWGSLNASVHDDLVTLGVGFRANLPQYPNADFGFAWEFPLTDEEATIMGDRFTFDLELRF